MRSRPNLPGQTGYLLALLQAESHSTAITHSTPGQPMLSNLVPQRMSQYRGIVDVRSSHVASTDSCRCDHTTMLFLVVSYWENGGLLVIGKLEPEAAATLYQRSRVLATAALNFKALNIIHSLIA